MKRGNLVEDAPPHGMEHFPLLIVKFMLLHRCVNHGAQSNCSHAWFVTIITKNPWTIAQKSLWNYSFIYPLINGGAFVFVGLRHRSIVTETCWTSPQLNDIHLIGYWLNEWDSNEPVVWCDGYCYWHVHVSGADNGKQLMKIIFFK